MDEAMKRMNIPVQDKVIVILDCQSSDFCQFLLQCEARFVNALNANEQVVADARKKLTSPKLELACDTALEYLQALQKYNVVVDLLCVYLDSMEERELQLLQLISKTCKATLGRVSKAAGVEHVRTLVGDTTVFTLDESHIFYYKKFIEDHGSKTQ